MAYILFDIGGTNTRVAVSRDLKTIDNAIKFKTPAKFTEGIMAIHEAIESLTSDPIEAMAGGVRGVLNQDKTALVREQALPGWVEQPLAASLERPWRTKVFIENDTAVGALGEAHFGAGAGYAIVAYHTVSTGVGGARVVGGRLDEASQGFEPGHQILDIDQSVLGEGTPHTLENLVSGRALSSRRGVPAPEIPQDDPVWPELAGYLARGLRNTIVYWSPDVLVLGGAMIIGNPRIQLADIERETKALLEGVAPCPPILEAKLGDEAGLYGAMVLIEQRS